MKDMKRYISPETEIVSQHGMCIICTSPSSINDLDLSNEWGGDGDIFND